MDIMPVSSGGFRPNATYDSAHTAAAHARFSEMLQSARTKADAAVSSEEADAEKQRQELREACQGFEALFLDMMFREMRKTVPKDELFGESNAMDIYRDMHDSEVMKQVSKSGGIGLGDMLYRQLSPQVEKQIETLAKQQGREAQTK